MRESKQKTKVKQIRTDKKKNIAKVVKSMITNPLQTQREIAKSAKIGLGTVNRTIKEVEHNGTKDDRILGICDTDIQNVCLGQKILQDRLKKQSDTLKVGEIVDIIQEGTRRYTLFKGDVTDKDGGLKNPLTPEEQKKLLDRFKLDE